MVIIATFDDYLREIKKETIIPVASLEFLYPNENVEFEVGCQLMDDGGQMNVTNQNGIRRTATVKINNNNRNYNIGIDDIYFGRKVRLMAGILLSDGTPYMLPQGVFYINNPTEAYNPTDKTITLQLVDKWAWLDGSLNGSLDGIYQIKVDDNMFTAISELLKKDRGNGEELDCIPPVFDSYYLDKTSKRSDGTVIPFLNAPYTLRTEATGSYADVILGVNTMLVSTCGYDNVGRLRISSAQTDILDNSRPIAWNFSITEKEFLGTSYTHQFSEMYNDVRVVGAVLDGSQVQSSATNRNLRSDTCVQKVGYKTITLTNSKYYTAKQCNEYAKYELRKRAMIKKSVSFNTAPIYHLQENQLITLIRSDISDKPELFLVTGFSLPIGSKGTMTINAVSIDDLDIFENWVQSYYLSAISSQYKNIEVYADDIPVADGNMSVIDGDPYTKIELMPKTNVRISVKGDKTIDTVRLNAVSVDHTDTSCEFVMPEYDSTIVFKFE